MHRAVFVYARSDSRRLPGKMLIPFAGSSLVEIVLGRAQRVGAETCALLTSDRPVDDALVAIAKHHHIKVVRGHAQNLVARSLQALKETGATHFLRVNGDFPLFEPYLAKKAMENLQNADLLSNLFDRRFPYGVAVEWIAASTYVKCASTARPKELEHVTQHLYRQAKTLEALSMTQPRDDSSISLTVDTAEDHLKLTTLIGNRNPITVSYWQLLGLDPPSIMIQTVE